jgi:Domain of unknown function (DUF4258)
MKKLKSISRSLRLLAVWVLAFAVTTTSQAGLLGNLLPKPSTVIGVAVIGAVAAAAYKENNCKTARDRESGKPTTVCKSQNIAKAEGAPQPIDKDPSTPTGQRGAPMDIKPGTNEPQTIGGRDFTGHSLDQMQGRGVTPTAVEDAIENGAAKPDKEYPESRTEHASQDGRVVVITATDSGRVITVMVR